MSDLTEHDAALGEWCIDCKEYDKERHSCPRWNRVIRKTAEDMKAAQPTQTIAESTQDFGRDTNVPSKDLISRQAAIDALDKRFDSIPMEQTTEILLLRKDLRNLPSAQPERTCLNCGRTANNGGWYADGRTRCPIEEHYALPKDGYCHLWEKRNVTDDDYPERRTDGFNQQTGGD